jgi:hypothetical protein
MLHLIDASPLPPPPSPLAAPAQVPEEYELMWDVGDGHPEPCLGRAAPPLRRAIPIHKSIPSSAGTCAVSSAYDRSLF